MCLQTGAGDLKTPNILNLICDRFFTHFLKKMKKSHFSRFLKIISSTRLNCSMHFILSEHGRQTPTELDQSILRWSIPHFLFHCEILTIDLTDFVTVSFTFQNKNIDF